jgi:hypothetical protein
MEVSIGKSSLLLPESHSVTSKSRCFLRGGLLFETELVWGSEGKDQSQVRESGDTLYSFSIWDGHKRPFCRGGKSDTDPLRSLGRRDLCLWRTWWLEVPPSLMMNEPIACGLLQKVRAPTLCTVNHLRLQICLHAAVCGLLSGDIENQTMLGKSLNLLSLLLPSGSHTSGWSLKALRPVGRVPSSLGSPLLVQTSVLCFP